MFHIDYHIHPPNFSHNSRSPGETTPRWQPPAVSLVLASLTAFPINSVNHSRRLEIIRIILSRKGLFFLAWCPGSAASIPSPCRSLPGRVTRVSSRSSAVWDSALEPKPHAFTTCVCFSRNHPTYLEVTVVPLFTVLYFPTND